MKRTSQRQGRRNIAWLAAFLEAKRNGQQVNLLSCEARQGVLFYDTSET